MTTTGGTITTTISAAGGKATITATITVRHHKCAATGARPRLGLLRNLLRLERRKPAAAVHSYLTPPVMQKDIKRVCAEV